MHPAILNNIYAEHGLHDKESQIAHIRALRLPTRFVWNAYRNQRVKMDYRATCIQESYLLRYYIPYSYLIEAVLHKTGAAESMCIGDNNVLDVSLFGCGPAPELLGILRHIAKKSARTPTKLRANLFDIANDSWAYGRRIAKECLQESQQNSALHETLSSQADLASPALLHNENVREAIKRSHLVVIQNCINELASESSTSNIKHILALMPVGSQLALIDRVGYGQTQQLCHFLDNQLDNRYACVGGANDDYYDGSSINAACPTALLGNLFYIKQRINDENQGLVLANGVRYCWRMIAKH